MGVTAAAATRQEQRRGRELQYEWGCRGSEGCAVVFSISHVIYRDKTWTRFITISRPDHVLSLPPVRHKYRQDVHGRKL